MKRLTMLLAVWGVVLLLAGCSRQPALSGTYVAQNLVQTGETMTQAVVFLNGKVTMIAGSVEQTVTYKLKQDQLVIYTEYGDFAYSFKQNENSIFIDDVEYAKQSETETEGANLSK